jgi:hypothetical protein
VFWAICASHQTVREIKFENNIFQNSEHRKFENGKTEKSEKSKPENLERLSVKTNLKNPAVAIPSIKNRRDPREARRPFQSKTV